MMYKIYNKSVPEYIYKEFSIKNQCINLCLQMAHLVSFTKFRNTDEHG